MELLLLAIYFLLCSPAILLTISWLTGMESGTSSGPRAPTDQFRSSNLFFSRLPVWICGWEMEVTGELKSYRFQAQPRAAEPGPPSGT